MMREVVIYYRKLYSLLSAQAMRAAGSAYATDTDMTTYLMDLLKKHGADLDHRQATNTGAYTKVILPLSDKLSDDEAHNLFTPRTTSFDFAGRLCATWAR